MTENENGITNAINIFRARGSGPHIMASNNDAVLRVFDAGGAALRCIRCGHRIRIRVLRSTCFSAE